MDLKQSWVCRLHWPDVIVHHTIEPPHPWRGPQESNAQVVSFTYLLTEALLANGSSSDSQERGPLEQAADSQEKRPLERALEGCGRPEGASETWPELIAMQQRYPCMSTQSIHKRSTADKLLKLRLLYFFVFGSGAGLNGSDHNYWVGSPL